MLLGSSLPTLPILSSSSSSILSFPKTTFGDSNNFKGKDEKQLGATSSPLTSPAASVVTAAAAVVGIVGLKPEVRNDSGEINDTGAQGAQKIDGVDDSGQDGEEVESGGENKQGSHGKEEDEVDGEDGGDGAEGGGEDDDPEPGNSGKAIAGHGQTTSPSGIPVASTAVAVVCVLGICVFAVYLARKRKRARARAAWVDSVFGVGGQTGPNQNPYSGSNTHNNRASSRNTMAHMSHHPHQQEDLESVSDCKSEMADRRPSMTVVDTHCGSVMVTDSYPRAIRTSIIIPAAVRNSMGALGRNYSHIPHSNAGYSRRTRRRVTLGNEVVFHNDPYEEYYDQIECEEDGGLAHLADDYSPAAPTVIASPAHVFAPTSQRPGALVYSESKEPSHHHRLSYGIASSHPGQYVHQHEQQLHHRQRPIDPNVYLLNRQPLTSQPQQHQSYQQARSSSPVSPFEHTEYEDPFRDALHPLAVPQPRRRPRSQHLISHRHSMRLHSAPASGTSSGTPHHRPSVSDYRRPHSFTLGLTGRESGEEPISFRTHVLDDNDSESLNSEVELTTSKCARRVASSGTIASIPRRLSGTLKHHFKRLSSPYVQSIRQQQQDHVANSLSYLEEGLGSGSGRAGSDGVAGGGNGCESLMAVPGQAPGTERRWSRGLLKSVVFGGSSSVGSRCTKDQVAVTAASGDEQIEEMRGDAVGGTWAPAAVGHRQAHSGSLASFRGLDDPNHPQLRVMNPDDGAL
ncbi:hypothetical protein EDD21DRAFT_358441 [Dissophora ornata]|nr:hypothetical protein EDD21DRAFT_358441 [Dissophora ornata]